MHSVLFVCTANQCRSPMAEGLMRMRVGVDNPDWRITSAGTWAGDGIPATSNAVQVLRDRGYLLDHHLSRQVDEQIIASNKLILVMERNHKEALRIEFSKYASRIFLLSEMIDKNYSIDDPAGGSLTDYQITAREIDMILERGFGRIDNLSLETD